MIFNSTKFKDLKLIKLKKLNDLRDDPMKFFDKKNKSSKSGWFDSYISKLTKDKNLNELKNYIKKSK